MSTTSQGITQSVQIVQGRISHQNRTAEVGAVVKIKRDNEYDAWRAAGSNGADDIQFRSEAGDTYIASGAGFEGLGLHLGAEVTLGGVKGRITAMDNEVNGKTELWMSRIGHGALFAVQAGFCAFLLGMMVVAPFSVPAWFVFTGLGAAVGLAGGLFGIDARPNLDLLKLHGEVVR